VADGSGAPPVYYPLQTSLTGQTRADFVKGFVRVNFSAWLHQGPQPFAKLSRQVNRSWFSFIRIFPADHHNPNIPVDVLPAGNSNLFCAYREVGFNQCHWSFHWTGLLNQLLSLAYVKDLNALGGDSYLSGHAR